MRVFLLILAISMVTITGALACTCASENTSLKNKVTKAFLRSDIIFTGNVVAIKDLNTNTTWLSSGDPIEYTFEIIEQIKGVDTKRKIQILSARSGASCGYRFQLGKTYLVFALKSSYHTTITKNNFDYSTSICTRNNHVARISKKEKKLLKRLSRKRHLRNKIKV